MDKNEIVKYIGKYLGDVLRDGSWHKFSIEIQDIGTEGEDLFSSRNLLIASSIPVTKEKT